MLIGHYGAAFAAKALAPRLSLLWLFVAVQAVDILWVFLVLSGIESVRIDPQLPSNHLDLHHIPFTHSLPATLLWSVLAFFVARRLLGKEKLCPTLVVAAAVGSHWLLDFLVHRRDLSLGFGGPPKVGLALWNQPLLAYLLEAGLLAAGFAWYLRSCRVSGSGRAWALGFGAGLLVLHTAAFVGPAPPTVDATVISALLLFVGLPLFAGRVELAAGQERVGELIIGHTTHRSAKLWVRGDKWLKRARITLVGPRGEPVRAEIPELPAERDFTGVATIDGLCAETNYEVVAQFPSSPAWLDSDGAVTRRGSLRTFPPPESKAGFSFLLGSCNFSTARLTSLAQFLAGFLGTRALDRSVDRPIGAWYWPGSMSLRGLIRSTIPSIARLATGIVQRSTRHEPREPAFPSPFRALIEQLHRRPCERPAFMIHAGDQIYFDLDVPRRDPEVEEYRRAYRQTWFQDPKAREFLARCPHYMILDDHDIVDAFANDAEDSRQRDQALKAYREYVHERQPDERDEHALYYRFQHGQALFFVLDTRSQRSPDRMIGERQLEELLDWMGDHRAQLKFVVSSVPFVAQLRPPEGDEADDRQDKWCGERFRKQRDAIIEFIHRTSVERLVFLTGDMHCSYHATMQVGRPDRRVVLHELAGGPINQVQFTPRKRFHDHYRSATGSGLAFTSLLRSYHGAATSVTRVTVESGSSPVLRWEVVRTAAKADSEDRDGSRYEPEALRGRIRF